MHAGREVVLVMMAISSQMAWHAIYVVCWLAHGHGLGGARVPVSRLNADNGQGVSE